MERGEPDVNKIRWEEGRFIYLAVGVEFVVSRIGGLLVRLESSLAELENIVG